MTLSGIGKSLSQMKEIDGIYKNNMTRGSRRFIRGFSTSARPQSMGAMLFGLEILC